MASVDFNKLLALSYVYVSRDHVHPSNVFGGFLPFILAMGAVVPGTRMDAHAIARRLHDGFGWDVSGDFVLHYVGDLLRHSLVEKRGEDFFWTEAAKVSGDEKAAADVADLRAAFLEFSSELAGDELRHLGAEERLHHLAQALVTNRLFSEDALEAFASTDEDASPPSGIDYVCARFVRHCFRADRKSFDALASLSQLGIICQLGTFFARPPPTEKITGRLLVILDGPFLVDLLGFGGEDRRADAALTVKLARERKARIAVFAHSVDEARDVVRGVLTNEPALRFGPTAAALRNGSISQAILDAFVQTPRQIVEGTKLVDEIIASRDKRIVGGREYFDNDDWQALFGSLSGWTKDLARERDCESVRNVMRLRRGATSPSVWASGAVLLSSNLSLARISKQVCTARDLMEADAIGPVISRFQLAALLWWSGGSKEKSEIASVHLLAAASAFLSRDSQLIKKVQKYAFGVDRQRQELVEAFVGTPLSYEFLQDATLGGASRLDENAVSHVLDRLVEHGRREGAEVERAKIEALLEQEKGAATTAQRDAEALQDAVGEAKATADRLTEDLRAAEVARQLAEAEALRQKEANAAIEGLAREREQIALREILRAQKAQSVVIALLNSRENTWSQLHETVRALVSVGRWTLIGAICLLTGAISFVLTANAEWGIVGGAVAFLAGLIGARLYDGGRSLEQDAARKITRRILESARAALDSELGPHAPAVVLDISESGVSISNKELVVQAFSE